MDRTGKFFESWLGVFGVGMSCSLVPSYNEMVKSAQERGAMDTVLLYGIISAIFNASYNAGEGIGPLIAGIIMTYANFEVNIGLSFSKITFSGSLAFILVGLAIDCVFYSCGVYVPCLPFFAANCTKY